MVLRKKAQSAIRFYGSGLALVRQHQRILQMYEYTSKNGTYTAERRNRTNVRQCDDLKKVASGEKLKNRKHQLAR